MNTKYFPVAIALIVLCGSVHADEIDNVYSFCNAMQMSGATECEVSAWGRTVDATVNTNGAEAKSICTGSVAVLTSFIQIPPGRWKLRIFSPYSGERPIAVCAM